MRDCDGGSYIIKETKVSNPCCAECEKATAWPIIIFYCCVFLFVSIIFFGSFWYQATKKYHPKNIGEHVERRPPFAEHAKFLNRDNLCNSYYRRLSNPQYQDKTNSSSNVECELIFFGFIHDGVVWFQSNSNDDTWAKSRLSSDRKLPFHLKDCYEIGFPEYGTPTVVFTNKCAGLEWRSLLFLTSEDNEYCRRQDFKCVEIFKSVPDLKMRKRLRSAGKYFKSTKALKISATDSAVVMVVKKKFNFKFSARFSKFSVYDPEYDCVAFDVEINKVISRNCEDEGCSTCIANVE